MGGLRGRYYPAGKCDPRVQGPGRCRRMSAARFRLRRSRYFDADGKQLGERVMPKVDGLDFVGYCGIPRPVLQEILVDEATENGARLRLGITAESLHDTGRSVEVDLQRWHAGQLRPRRWRRWHLFQDPQSGFRRQSQAALLRAGLLALHNREAAGNGLQRDVLRPQQGRVDPAHP